MQTYLGAKIIQAEPQMVDFQEGYRVVYEDGYESWSPKDVFETAYRPVDPRWELVEIAKVCHEVNRAYCAAIGDLSQIPWDGAPQWQRDSAVSGVQFHMENPEADVAASHNEWMRHKLDDGWTYGPEKNTDVKQHPCLVPFQELPQNQQVKDWLFRAVVHAMK